MAQDPIKEFPSATAVDKSQAVATIVRNQPDFVVRTYSRIRFVILRQHFLEEIGQYFPRQGRVLDLGCGFGLFALYYALTGPERHITGVELNARRVKMAQACAERLGLTNTQFTAQDALTWQGTHEFDAIYMLDLIHHLPKDHVAAFLRGIVALLRDGGVLLLKDVSNRPAYKRLFTLWLDRLMVGLREPIHYWSPVELVALLEGLGLTVRQHTMNDILPYPHMLYVCHKPLPLPSEVP
jgi:2-polyprenyl-3-methyl-5-hydroxy-6-metoxy-1,4-benzoquinol methylase